MDVPVVHAINERAFGRALEADLADCLRASEAGTGGISLVAEAEGGALVGHVLVTWVELVADEATRRILSLSPLAVHPDHQGRGVGAALTRAALAEAESRSEPIVVVLGHPTYYPRLGFEPARALGIEPPMPVRDEAWMACRLAGWDPQIRGRVVYPSCFDGIG